MKVTSIRGTGITAALSSITVQHSTLKQAVLKDISLLVMVTGRVSEDNGEKATVKGKGQKQICICISIGIFSVPFISVPRCEVSLFLEILLTHSFIVK